jgi:hypothetical protein
MAKCPHCEGNVTLQYAGRNSLRKEVKGGAKKEVMYSCPHCDKVLGFAFFFGGLLTGRP